MPLDFSLRLVVKATNAGTFDRPLVTSSERRRLLARLIRSRRVGIAHLTKRYIAPSEYPLSLHIPRAHTPSVAIAAAAPSAQAVVDSCRMLA